MKASGYALPCALSALALAPCLAAQPVNVTPRAPRAVPAPVPPRVYLTITGSEAARMLALPAASSILPFAPQPGMPRILVTPGFLKGLLPSPPESPSRGRMIHPLLTPEIAARDRTFHPFLTPEIQALAKPRLLRVLPRQPGP